MIASEIGRKGDERRVESGTVREILSLGKAIFNDASPVSFSFVETQPLPQ